MKNISRYILVAIAVLAFVVALPQLYWLAFEKPIGSPFIMYSCVDNDFVFVRSGIRIVITSYSIHYTKLYESQFPCGNISPSKLLGIEVKICPMTLTTTRF